jgi:hypothetical protein
MVPKAQQTFPSWALPPEKVQEDRSKPAQYPWQDGEALRDTTPRQVETGGAYRTQMSGFPTVQQKEEDSR